MSVSTSTRQRTSPTQIPTRSANISTPIELGVLNNTNINNGAREDTSEGTTAKLRPTLAVAGSSRTLLTSRAPSRVGPAVQSNTTIPFNTASREGSETGHPDSEVSATLRVVYGQAFEGSSRYSTAHGISTDINGAQKNPPVTPDNIRKLGDLRLAIDGQ